MEFLFSKHKDFSGVIHFAAYKAVGESVEDPLKYYDNNVLGFITLFNLIKERKIPLIFSSSATIYGDADSVPIKENAPIKEAFSPLGLSQGIEEAPTTLSAKIIFFLFFFLKNHSPIIWLVLPLVSGFIGTA